MTDNRPRRRPVVLAALTTLSVSLVLPGCAALEQWPAFPDLPNLTPDEVAALDLVPEAPQLGLDLDPGTLTPDGFDAIQRMAVRIRNIGCGTVSTGSGFAIDEYTLITNRHVVADARVLQVSTHDGRDVEVDAASSAKLADIAVIRTASALADAPRLADRDPEVGDEVTIVGFPEGRQLTVTTGVVKGRRLDPVHENLGEVLVTNALVEPGSSGSAALNAAGEVVGVVYAKTAGGMSLLVPVSWLRALLNDEGAFAPVEPCG